MKRMFGFCGAAASAREFAAVRTNTPIASIASCCVLTSRLRCLSGERMRDGQTLQRPRLLFRRQLFVRIFKIARASNRLWTLNFVFRRLQGVAQNESASLHSRARRRDLVLCDPCLTTG